MAASGSIRSRLLLFRSLQVLISLAVCVYHGLALWLVSCSFDQYRRQTRARLEPKNPELVREMDGVFAGVMAMWCVFTAFGLLSFILSMTWLVFTTSPKNRARAHCIGNHVLCARYTCDMAWDIVMVLYWAVLAAFWAFAMSGLSSIMHQQTALPIVALALSCFMFVSYIITAALSSAVRKQMRDSEVQAVQDAEQGSGSAKPGKGSEHVVHMHAPGFEGRDAMGRDVVGGGSVDVYKWRQVPLSNKPIKG